MHFDFDAAFALAPVILRRWKNVTDSVFRSYAARAARTCASRNSRC